MNSLPKLRDVVVVLSAAGVVIGVGYSIYRFYKEGKTPGIVPAVAITSLTGMLLFSLRENPSPVEIAKAGRLLPPVLGG